MGVKLSGLGGAGPREPRDVIDYHGDVTVSSGGEIKMTSTSLLKDFELSQRSF